VRDMRTKGGKTKKLIREPNVKNVNLAKIVQKERKKEISRTFHFKRNRIIDLITSNKVKNFQFYN
jgi:hypothetical protein